MSVHPELLSYGLRKYAVFGLTAAALAGCAENSAFSFLQQDDSADRAVSVSDRSVPLIERDVEAPDVFKVTDRGLWDGRPSLGGIWVAHPDVDKPERVIIRNTENSEFVIGALFRRERDNPGPIFMVSSDAAAELGMLAGAPAKLDVTALRREETPDPEAEAAAAAAAALAAETEATAAQTEETLAALSLPDAEVDGDLATDAVVSAAAAVTAAEADALAAESQAAETESTVLASVSATEVAQEPEIDDKDKKFLQIGIFSQQANAERTASIMTAAGMAPTIKTEAAEGLTFWRVVIGPADSVFDRTSMLEVVRREGFVDAFPVGE